MADAATVEVEVVYALRDRQTIIKVSVPADACIADAIAESGIAARHPEIDLATNTVGIFGRSVTLKTRPIAGDRIEIYRPLQANPGQMRRMRVKSRKLP